MIELDGKIFSKDLLEEKFACELSSCKGMCCVIGDSGAPVTVDEVKVLLRNFAKNNLPKTLTTERLNNAAFKSIAWNFATKVLGSDPDDKDLTTLLNSLLSKEQQGMMEVN